VRTVAAETIAVGDRLLVRPGELVPCNAVVLEGRSHVDASRLTGEPVPISAQAGTPLLSGSVNGEGALTVRATAVAAESEYAKIVGLVREAQASKAPLQRAADRYAVWFTPVTLLACTVAYLVSGDPTRVLAVLVVATPCPLLLATPVAIIGGISRAARRGVIVRNGAALEHLARVRTAVFDKTGTMTIGRPRVRDVRTLGRVPARELLRLAAGVEQGSSHLLARSVVEAAEQAGALPSGRHVTEDAGRGVVGEVEGRRVTVGSRSLLEARGLGAADAFDRLDAGGAQLRAYVAVGGVLEGAIEFADAVRDAAPALLRELKSIGVRKNVMLSGDSAANTAAVARALGMDEARGDLLPGDKVAAVHELARGGAAVAMIGDGTNDAPALAAATVGIALASHGGGISAEAADVVVLADDVGRVAEAVRIGRRTMRVARQSIWVGLGLSAAAMVAAAFGLIPPATGALLQEAIDVAVILNALRTSRPARANDVSVFARPRSQAS
jgi:heavy metal translocating P-type ATPase